MNKLTRAGIAAGAVIAVLLGAGCSPAPGGAAPVPSVSMPAPKTQAAPSASAQLKPGEVRLEPGPFTDRVELADVRLDTAGTATVHGRIKVTTDVSHLIAMDLRAAFYDAAGTLLGTGQAHYEEDEAQAPAAEHVGLEISVPADKPLTQVSAAILSVPVLVNE